MSEPSNNIVAICKECADARYRIMQKKIDTKLNALPPNGTIWFKVALKDKDIVEHVWIKIQSIDKINKTFTGIIDNELVAVRNYTCEQQLTLDFNEIEDMLSR